MFRCAQFAALSTVLLAAVGCARWTLRPPAGATAQIDGGQHLASPDAMDAAGQRRFGAGASAPATTSTGAQDAVAANFKNLDPSLSIARLAERQGDPQQARILYTRYIQKNPDHPLPHHRLGVMAAREAKYEEAEQHFARAMKLAPPSVELLSDVGYCYYLLDRLDEAEQVLRQGSQAEPANVMVNNNLALVMAAKGDFAESAQTFRRVNDEGQARANQAYALSQNGNLEQAREEYLRALTVDNTLTSAAKALLQVDKQYKLEQQALARAEQPAQDPALTDNGQPMQIIASDSQNVVPASYEASPAPRAAARSEQVAYQTAARPAAAQSQTRDLAPRGQDMAAMLMPVPSASSPLPAANPTRYDTATTDWNSDEQARWAVQQAGWNEPPSAVQPVRPAAATAPRRTSGIAINLSDERAAGGQPARASLSDSP